MLLPITLIGQTQSENYVKTITYKSPNSQNPVESITYLDGLGRPIQNITVGQSATGKNIVTPIEYDQYGRQVKEYMPYATQANTLDFVPSAINDAGVFYNTNYYQNTLNPYSEKQFEASPLARVKKLAAMGNDWAMGNGKEIKFEYQTNGTNEVKLYYVNSIWDSNKGLYEISLGNSSGNTYYQPNRLFKSINTDENNNVIHEFIDKEGKVILKRTFENNEAHDTYYVFDQYGNLVYIITPKVNGVITQDILDELCYQYKYDSRDRKVEKKLPGKQWEFTVYDKLDRIVATGPVFTPFTDLSESGWMITKYDVFDRVVLTGFMPSTTVTSEGRKNLQNDRNLDSIISETKLVSTNSSVNGVDFRYTNLAFPASTTSYHLLTVNYYDDYNSNLIFNPAISFTSSITPEQVYYNDTIKPIGLSTMTWIRIPETKTLYKAEISYTLYDNKSRPTKTFTNNHLGGYTQIESQLEKITGRTNYSINKHKRLSTDNVIEVREDFTYTAQDRILTHTHKIGNGTTQLLSKNTYDELGQLISKNVGGNDITGATGLQKVDYQHNVRGWLTGINKVDGSPNPLQQGTDPLDLFAFKINYNSVEGDVDGVDPLYNGNISETYWRTSSDDVLRKYGYQYDNFSRLLNATYQKPQNAVAITKSYNESISYDKNGNITSLDRNGDFDDPINPLVIDELSYTYSDNSNKLVKVTDAINTSLGFKDDSDGTNDTVDDYTYDLNGNMISDQNKGIVSIKYNHLNLPTEIVFTGTNKKINYLYNSIGEKVEKKTTIGSVITITDYIDGFQYIKNGSSAVALQFFHHSEGYVSNTVANGINNYNYVFNYFDNIGNVRLSYTLDPATNVLTILEENHYYPFGLKHTKYNIDQAYYDANGGTVTIKTKTLPFKFRYQGQEWQDELGLNWYSFKWRNEDPAIARFMNVDPLAEVYEWQSIYAFGSNQPVHAKEIEGMESAEDKSANNRSWSFSNFLQGAQEQLVGTLKSAILPPVPIGAPKAAVAAVKGDYKALLENEPTGIYNATKTIYNAATGDDKAQGQVAAMIFTAFVTKKILGAPAASKTSSVPKLNTPKASAPKTAPKTSTTASTTASKASAGRTGAKPPLPDDAKVVRGGANKATNWENGSGVKLDSKGKMIEASVNSVPNASVETLSTGIPHPKIGVSTVGEVRSLGGDVISSPTKTNPLHATLTGITPLEAEKLFTPTLPNPNTTAGRR